MGRTLRKEVAAMNYNWTFNTQFEVVMKACAAQERPGQDGTWITEEMLEAYIQLHEMGYAHCVEVWDGTELVGGLYGVSISGAFFGESMFSKVPGASKYAFAHFAHVLFDRGWTLIDCQIETEHLERFGAHGLPRVEFMRALATEGVSREHPGEKLLSRCDIRGSK